MKHKAYKFRIYPNKTQTVLLKKTFGAVRYAWNQWVDNFNNQHTKVFHTPKEFRDVLNWMKEISFGAIQQKERDFKKFKQQFFNKNRKKKLGRPSFKSRKQKQSYRLANNKFIIRENKIRLEKIGWVKMVIDRSIPKEDKMVNATISKDSVGDFYVSILVEETIHPMEKTGKSVGIDLGLNSFAVLSDETVIDNPRFFRENQSKIRRLSKALSKKQKGSNRFYRAKQKLAKAHRKIARQRNCFLHELSTQLVKEYDVIAIEDLNVIGMLKNSKLAKSISDASWSEFRRLLEYKADWYGKEVKVVGRFVSTSKVCNVCGYKYPNMDLKVREWDCLVCKSHHDRDVNASINILNKAVGVNAAQRTSRDCQPNGQQTIAELCEMSNIGE